MTQARPESETKSAADSGVLGTHPVSSGMGAAAGALFGATAGSLAGPVGAGIGAVAGAVMGGLAGNAVGEAIDPEIETEYWRSAFKTRSYVAADATFDRYEPAYRLGWEARARLAGRKMAFEEVEADLASAWEKQHAENEREKKERMDWGAVRPAVLDAWTRVHSRVSGAAATDTTPDDGELLKVLNGLIGVCVDGARAFVNAANKTPTLSDVLMLIGTERERMAAELAGAVTAMGGTPTLGGGAGATLHRTLANIRAVIKGEEGPILDECEREEDLAAAAYERAAVLPGMPAASQAVLARHREHLKRRESG